tara:strand:- start:37732 stop:38121 length:390 start_codon:yes stop_codon:yes gene_type:complete
MKLGDYLKSINHSKKSMRELGDDFQSVKKGYAPFVINRCLSFFPDTLMQANNMNVNHHLDKEMQYEYLRHAVRKRNRFSPWLKKNKPENLDAIKEYFGYSDQKAVEALQVLKESDVEKIIKELSKGGRA